MFLLTYGYLFAIISAGSSQQKVSQFLNQGVLIHHWFTLRVILIKNLKYEFNCSIISGKYTIWTLGLNNLGIFTFICSLWLGFKVSRYQDLNDLEDDQCQEEGLDNPLLILPNCLSATSDLMFVLGTNFELSILNSVELIIVEWMTILLIIELFLSTDEQI